MNSKKRSPLQWFPVHNWTYQVLIGWKVILRLCAKNEWKCQIKSKKVEMEFLMVFRCLFLCRCRLWFSQNDKNPSISKDYWRLIRIGEREKSKMFPTVKFIRHFCTWFEYCLIFCWLSCSLFSFFCLLSFFLRSLEQATKLKGKKIWNGNQQEINNRQWFSIPMFRV